MRHVVANARAGLEELIAEVAPENVPMSTVFERSGCPMRTRHEGQVVHVTLGLN
jgi:hypothetical protein